MLQRSMKRQTPAPSHLVLLSQAIDLDQVALQRVDHAALCRGEHYTTFSRIFISVEGAIKRRSGHCLRAYCLCMRVSYDWCVVYVVSGMLFACPGQVCD
jgi:hypothetical protein